MTDAMKLERALFLRAGTFERTAERVKLAIAEVHVQGVSTRNFTEFTCKLCGLEVCEHAQRVEADCIAAWVCLGAGLTAPLCRNAPSDRPALKPYWGIPAARNSLGEAMETSASFEARSAPSLYPTNLLVRIWRGPWVGNCPGLLDSGHHHTSGQRRPVNVLV